MEGAGHLPPPLSQNSCRREGSGVSKDQNWGGGRSLALTLCVSACESMQLSVLCAKVARVGWESGARLDSLALVLLCPILQITKLRHGEGEIL